MPRSANSAEKSGVKKPFFDCVRKPDLGFSRKGPFSTDKSDCTRNGLTFQYLFSVVFFTLDAFNVSAFA